MATGIGMGMFVAGMILWSMILYRWKQEDDKYIFPAFLSLMAIIGGLIIVSTNAHYNGLGYPSGQSTLKDGNYYELVCQGAKDNERVAVLNHLGNDGIRAYHLDELLPEGKKYYKAVKDKTTPNGKTLLVPTE